MKARVITMQEKTITKLFNKMLPGVKIETIKQIKHEDDETYYQVWLINETYILKHGTPNEIDVYQKIKENVPQLYASLTYYRKLYILINYLPGHNLMQGKRTDLKLVLNALAKLQDRYWQTAEKIGENIEDSLISRLKRGEHLKNTPFYPTYQKFLACYQNVSCTFNHDDLLPFNVLISNNEAYFIDFEYGGILPYLVSFARLIAHTKPEKDYLFYLSREDKNWAIKYYYEILIAKHNISLEKYLKDLDLFIFFEYTEWIAIHYKYNMPKDERFNYYWAKALTLADKINSLQQ